MNSNSTENGKDILTVPKLAFLEAWVGGMSGVDAYEKAYPDSGKTYDAKCQAAHRLRVELSTHTAYQEILDAAGLDTASIARKMRDLFNATDRDGFPDNVTQTKILQMLHQTRGLIVQRSEIDATLRGDKKFLIDLVREQTEADGKDKPHEPAE